MTVLSVFLPYFRFITETEDILTAPLPTMAGCDVPHVVNIILSGGIAVLGFHGSIRMMSAADRPDAEIDQRL
jgi:hypothetical protein